MIEGKTKTGFKFKIDERIISDLRVFEQITILQNGNPSEIMAATVTLVELIFGKDKKKLEEHIAKKNDGYVPIEVVTQELLDVLTSNQQLKNS